MSRAPVDPSLIGIGDRIDVTIWETAEQGLLAGAEGQRTLPAVEVEPDGSVFVPFVGPVRASGRTPAQLRAAIREALVPLTLEPQVDVRLNEPVSRQMTVQGAVARPGPYVLERSSLRLASMLAFAGGTTIPPEQAEVMVRRGTETARLIVEDLFDDPSLNIALRPHDLVVVSPIRDRLLVLGASNVQSEVTFPTRRLDLLRAIALARGLNDFDADPAGVFVFRRETTPVADRLLEGPEPSALPKGEGRPIIYQLDLTQPEALFVAKAFQMRNDDAIFVSNAPLTELRKILQMFTTLLTPVQATNTLTN
jgi:polysaccharide export outer membrane protein